MNKLKIAVWHNLPSGGGKRQLYDHVRGLVARGHHVESWCPDTADQKYLPIGSLVKENIIPLKHKSPLFNAPNRPLRVVKEILDVMETHCAACANEMRRGDFDVLFANACMYLRTSPIAGYIRLPSLLYLHEPYRWFYEAMPELPWIGGRRAIKRQYSWGMIRAEIIRRLILNGVRTQARAELEFAREHDLILANSVFSREALLRTYNLESKVCYLGIDTEYYQPTGESKQPFVVGVGTIYHGKGVDRAIRAIASIDKSIRPQLVWIGNGVSQAELDDYHRLANVLAVEFSPKVNISDQEVISYLSRATAMIYTSRLEPFGLAPLEANACGTPVVGIAEGGIKETVKDNINGFLAQDADPHVLGGLVERLIKNPKLASELGQRAREHVVEHWPMELGTANIEQQLVGLASQESGKKRLANDVYLRSLEPTGDIRLNLDTNSLKNGSLTLKGWAFIDDGVGSEHATVYVLAKSDAALEIIPTIKEQRPDVTDYFSGKADYSGSGFSSESRMSNVKDQKIGILIVRGEKIAFQDLPTPH